MSDTKALIPATSAPLAKNGNGATERKDFTPEQLRFIEWLACPEELREYPDQRALATSLKVNEFTLSRWKHLDGLDDAVIRRTRELLRVDDVSAILHSHAKLGRTSTKSAKLVLQAANVLGDAQGQGQQGLTVLIHNDNRPHDGSIDAISE